MPGLTAGMTPEWNSSVSRKIWPSVMEMTLVGIYAETSPACVSMIGRAVRLTAAVFRRHARRALEQTGVQIEDVARDMPRVPADGESTGTAHGKRRRAWTDRRR